VIVSACRISSIDSDRVYFASLIQPGVLLHLRVQEVLIDRS